MLSFALLALLEAAPRQPLLAYWVSHHDVPPPSFAPWSERSELPNLVLYDDGLVLLARGGVVESTTLGPEASKPFTEGQEAFFALPENVRATDAMHPPVHLVTRWRNGTRKTVRFFGALTEPNERAKAPPTLQSLLDRLTGFQPKTSTWVPEQLVVRSCKTTAKPEGKRWPAGVAEAGAGHCRVVPRSLLRAPAGCERARGRRGAPAEGKALRRHRRGEAGLAGDVGALRVSGRRGLGPSVAPSSVASSRNRAGIRPIARRRPGCSTARRGRRHR